AATRARLALDAGALRQSLVSECTTLSSDARRRLGPSFRTDAQRAAEYHGRPLSALCAVSGEQRGRQSVVITREPPHEQQRDAAEAWRAIGVAQVDPRVPVVDVDRKCASEVELHTRAGLVREAARAMIRLPTAADVAPPRIPPTASLRRPRSNVRVDPVPAEAHNAVGPDRPVQERVGGIEHHRAEVDVAVLDRRTDAGSA